MVRARSFVLRRSRALAALVSVLVVVTVFAQAGATTPGLSVTVVPRALSVDTETYPTDAGSAQWRVVSSASGNAFENYLTATASGDLYNFGGTYLRRSSDGGQSWVEIRPLVPGLGGEGAVVAAPNGDVLAVGWDTYSGDRVLSFKYTAATGTWAYTESPLHTPFFDRPWLALIPGPMELPTGTVPYVTILRGGWPSKDVVYYATDGLTYTQADLPAAYLLAPARTIAGAVNAAADWIQPHTSSTITPVLPAGGSTVRALQNRENQTVLCSTVWRALVTPNLSWNCMAPASAALWGPGRLLIDSDGRFHLVKVSDAGTSITYATSTDGARTWKSVTEVLPGSMGVEEWDFKVAGGALDVGVVAVHAHQPSTGTDQDLVLKFSTGNTTPALQRLYYLGDGDMDFGNGVGANLARFDFSSIAIMPSGKIAVSFADQAHKAAAIAIEL